MTESFDILRYPHITEKAALQKEQSAGRVLVFKVNRSVRQASGEGSCEEDL